MYLSISKPKRAKPVGKETTKFGKSNTVGIAGDNKPEESYNYGSTSSDITGSRGFHFSVSSPKKFEVI